ncbi:hypothetical protein VNO77_06076 [Canavalia gladiata]|uniref:Uncharacterized protein n=1 Tax=Canavalia gladiata TaxID=3824 RepID=A0AAN9MZG2_CANGL
MVLGTCFVKLTSLGGSLGGQYLFDQSWQKEESNTLLHAQDVFSIEHALRDCGWFHRAWFLTSLKISFVLRNVDCDVIEDYKATQTCPTNLTKPSHISNEMLFPKSLVGMV